MKLNIKRAIRALGIAMVAFFSALLGYVFTLQYNKETWSYFWMVVIFILIGGVLSSLD